MRPKILSQKIVFQNGWMKIRRNKIKFKNQGVAVWDDILGKDVVAVIPIDDKKNVYLVREWRSAWDKEVLHIPVGHAEGNTEKLRICQARNELREEACIDAKKIKKLTEVLIDLREKVVVYIYLAQDLFKSYKKPDKHEHTQVVKMSFRKAYRLLVSGKETSSAYNLLAFLLAKEKLKLRV